MGLVGWWRQGVEYFQGGPICAYKHFLGPIFTGKMSQNWGQSLGYWRVGREVSLQTESYQEGRGGTRKHCYHWNCSLIWAASAGLPEGSGQQGSDRDLVRSGQGKGEERWYGRSMFGQKFCHILMGGSWRSKAWEPYLNTRCRLVGNIGQEEKTGTICLRRWFIIRAAACNAGAICRRLGRPLIHTQVR